MNKKLNFEPRWFVVIVFFLVGIFIGGIVFFIWILNSSNVFGFQKIRSARSLYQFINPLLAVDVSEKKEFLETRLLKDKVTRTVQEKTKTNEISQFALYFKELGTGRWMGINADTKFSPGIFLKVPIMIAWLKSAESNPEILKESFIYEKTPVQEGEHNTGFVYGKPYSVEELIKAMIVDDDSDAANALFKNIDETALNDIYSDLGIEATENNITYDFISVKFYALIFRVLYNATYLSRSMSEKALEILSAASVDDGIGRNLPNNVVNAHKYRVREFAINGIETVEGHDCGIIYYPDHNYILCVMAMGHKTENINDLFNEVSIMIYDDMHSRYQLRKP